MRRQVLNLFLVVGLLAAAYDLCRIGLAAADVQEGFAAYNRGDFEAAKSKWQPLAEAGDADAQYNIGVMHARGEAFPADDATAVRWWKAAAAQRHPASMHNLGFMYATGRGTTTDLVEAYVWYSLAAEHQPLGFLRDGSSRARDLLKDKISTAQLRQAGQLYRAWAAIFAKMPADSGGEE